MKITNETKLDDGKVSVTVCMCKDGKTKCKEEERPRKIFKSKESMDKWKSSFHVGEKNIGKK